MSEFEKQLALMVCREKVRCICIMACVVIVMASVWGAMFYTMPPIGATSDPITYTYTDEAGTTTTTTINGRQTITTVTNADGKIISMCITGGRRRK